MSDFLVRGYIISRTIGYLTQASASGAGEKALARLSPANTRAIQNISAQEWYPVAIVSELNRIIVETIGQNEPERARQALHACGRFMGQEATNTYLKILLRLLTPALFGKKLPDFWRRDANRGRLEVEVTERKLSGRYVEVEGYDHLAAVATGFIGFALETLGKEIDKITLHDWSVNNPSSDGVRFDITWKE